MKSRDLKWMLQALAFGAVGLPLLIWSVGRVTLGPYANGGPLSLWFDFVSELLHGSIAAWVVLLAPCALLATARYAWRSTRRRSGGR